MVNRVQGPSFSQARRDATTQKLQQIAQAQDIQSQPLRNRLLELQAQQRQQEIDLVPRREARADQGLDLRRQELGLSQQRENRQQSIFESEEEKKRAAMFIETAPLLNAEAKRIRALESEDERRTEVARLKPILDRLGLSEGLDFNDVSNEALDQAVSITEPLIKYSTLSKTGKDNRTSAQKNFDELQNIRKKEAAGEVPTGSAEAYARDTGIQTAAVEAEQEALIAGEREAAKLKEKRTSDIRVELSERNRGARRAQAQAREALQAAANATQGIQGAVKVQLSRLFPDIDVADEALLDAKLKDLAIQGLQAFKGPTTDFELGYIESVAGKLSMGKKSNEARIKAFDRAMWFQERELKQFNDYMEQGGDPDQWRGFNYDEVINTGKGPVTLRDLRDTAAANHMTVEEVLRRWNE